MNINVRTHRVYLDIGSYHLIISFCFLQRIKSSTNRLRYFKTSLEPNSSGLFTKTVLKPFIKLSESRVQKYKLYLISLAIKKKKKSPRNCTMLLSSPPWPKLPFGSKMPYNIIGGAAAQLSAEARVRLFYILQSTTLSFCFKLKSPFSMNSARRSVWEASPKPRHEFLPLLRHSNTPG